MIGRTAELALLAEALTAATERQPRIVLVAGEAGIGKTRLIREACVRAERDGVLTAIGSCVQLGDSSVAYAAWPRGSVPATNRRPVAGPARSRSRPRRSPLPTY